MGIFACLPQPQVAVTTTYDGDGDGGDGGDFVSVVVEFDGEFLEIGLMIS